MISLSRLGHLIKKIENQEAGKRTVNNKNIEH